MVQYRWSTLDQWTKKTEKRIDAVLKDATQSVIAVAQQTKAKGGRMPVDTGNLRNSLQSSIAGGASGEGESSHILVAPLMEGGDVASQTPGAFSPHTIGGADGVAARRVRRAALMSLWFIRPAPLLLR